MRVPFTNYELNFKKRSVLVNDEDGKIPFEQWIKNNGILSSGSNTPILENIYHSIAMEIGKIDLKHVKCNDGEMVEVNDDLDKLLKLRPNKYQSKFDFMYTFGYQLTKYKQFYALIKRDNKGRCLSIEPIDASDYLLGSTLYEVNDGQLYIKLKDKKTKEIIPINYQNVVHVRFNPNGMFKGEYCTGIDSSMPIVKLFDTTLASLLEDLNSSGTIYGVVTLGSSEYGWSTKALADESSKQNKQKEIINRIKSTKGNILVLDAGEQWTPLVRPFSTTNTDQVDGFLQFLYEFHSINKKVVNGTATYHEMEVFFNKTIAPRLEQLVLELTYKIFSEQARAKGNAVVYYRNPFEYLPIDKAMDCAYKSAMDTTTNERRRMIYKLSNIDGGDALMSNKNFEQVKGDNENDDEQDN